MFDLQSAYDLKDVISNKNTCAIYFYAEKHEKSNALQQVYVKLSESIKECEVWATCLVNCIADSRSALKVNEVPCVWFCRNHAIERIVLLPQAQLYVKEARSVFVEQGNASPVYSFKETMALLDEACASAEEAAKQWIADRPLLFLTTDTQSPICQALLPEVIILEDVANVERFKACLRSLGLPLDTENALVANGQVVGHNLEVLNPDLKELIAKVAPIADETLVKRCQEIVNRHPLMIIMKGTREAPYCKFSKQLLAILKEHNIENWDYFNIFTDNAVRERLKSLYNWPTFPQIYVRGKLLGGLDTVKKLAENVDVNRPSSLEKALFAGGV